MASMPLTLRAQHMTSKFIPDEFVGMQRKWTRR